MFVKWVVMARLHGESVLNSLIRSSGKEDLFKGSSMDSSVTFDYFCIRIASGPGIL